MAIPHAEGEGEGVSEPREKQIPHSGGGGELQPPEPRGATLHHLRFRMT